MMIADFLLQNIHVLICGNILFFRFIIPILYTSPIYYYAGYAIGQIPISFLLDVYNPFLILIWAFTFFTITANAIYFLAPMYIKYTCLSKFCLFVHGVIAACGFLGVSRVCRNFGQILEYKLLFSLMCSSSIYFILSFTSTIYNLVYLNISLPIIVLLLWLCYKKERSKTELSFIGSIVKSKKDLLSFYNGVGCYQFFNRIALICTIMIIATCVTSPMYWYMLPYGVRFFGLCNVISCFIMLLSTLLSYVLCYFIRNLNNQARLGFVLLFQIINRALLMLLIKNRMSLVAFPNIMISYVTILLICTLANSMNIILIRFLSSHGNKYSTLLTSVCNFAGIGTSIVSMFLHSLLFLKYHHHHLVLLQNLLSMFLINILLLKKLLKK